MIQLPEEFDSIFRYIVVVSQRAEQLINGAKPRVESRRKKPTLQAMADVDEHQVQWRVLTQQELDAQRQAIVDQFRAEVSGDELRVRPPIPDVLPTEASGESPDDEPVEAAEKDDEISRLQRLLGLATGGGKIVDDDAGFTDDEEIEDLDDIDADDFDETENDFEDGEEEDFDDNGTLDLDEDDEDDG
jgi:DNA-directed RNA polymerase subunit K/omega